MRKSPHHQSAFFYVRALLASTLCGAGAALLAVLAFGANPPAGSLGPGGPGLVWVGTGVGGEGDPSGEVSSEDSCVDGVNCDVFTLTLTGSAADWAGKKARVQIKWMSNTHDYDLFIHKDTVDGPAISSSATGGQNTEVADIDPNRGAGTGVFVVHVVYFNVPPIPLDQYNGTVTVVGAEEPGGSPFAPPGTARMYNSTAPPGIGDAAGEPSIGCNWTTERSFSNSMFTIPNGGTSTYYGGFLAEMLRVIWNDCSSPAKATWEEKPLVLAATPRALGDPILFTDNVTGRTFVAQEEAQAGATTDVTDDDGDTFMPSAGSGPPAGIDHETIASGTYHAPTPPTATYPATGPKHAVYYASQSVSDARTSRSDDGGITFGPAVPMYTTADCGGLHGHLKVTPDTPATRANGTVGTVYVPNNACGGTVDPIGHTDGQQAAIVSEDNGITWSVRPVPGSTTKSDRDPSIGVATDGSIYMGMQSQDGHPRISVSHDQGRTWTAPFDVGAAAGIQNCVFPAVIAGDPDRAAFAFFGTTTGGNDYDQPFFTGVWYLYMAVTYDGGQSWTTINVTPNDPIQRGGICGSGTCRNLLDFFDATIDKEGRILIGYEDGCIGPCVDGGGNSFTAKAAISRQGGGKRMFAAFDPVETALPGAPSVTATMNESSIVTLKWPAPDDSGSPITGYRIYRGTSPGGETFLANTGIKGAYVDTATVAGTTYYYRVTAVNGIGEGPYCGEVTPEIVPGLNPCELPGITILTDPSGDLVTPIGITSVPDYDLRSLSLAEPFGITDKIVFTVKVESLLTMPPNTRWPVQFRLAGDPANLGRWVDMRTDALGMASFKYGTFVVTNGAYGAPATVVGDADAESTFNPNGSIKIVISRSKIGNPAPGSILQGFLIRVRINDTLTPDNMPNDLAPAGVYAVTGNEACRLNTAPLASLIANPSSGPAPLTVNFDASGSSDLDSGDTIASYTFNFGDGTPDVTQASPLISHTYTHPANSFFAILRVTDSRGKVSINPAVRAITTNAVMLNIATRLRVDNGNSVGIGGFIITGTEPKKVVIRGIGPSIQPNIGTLSDPTLELHNQSSTLASNDNWKVNDQTQQSQEAEITATGLAPANDKEAAILTTLAPGQYTAILRGKNSTGIGLVEVYDVDRAVDSQLGNISTRGLVELDNNVMIGGFIIGPGTSGPAKVVVRAIGPSISSSVPNALADPSLEVFDQNGQSIARNDDWRQDADADQIEAAGLAPAKDAESAVLLKSLVPGPYTAIVRGANRTVGVGLVEAYNIR
ncbi:MAG: hypothetical protein QOG27_1545 [Verrucomicrobiota bacterium]